MLEPTIRGCRTKLEAVLAADPKHVFARRLLLPVLIFDGAAPAAMHVAAEGAVLLPEDPLIHPRRRVAGVLSGDSAGERGSGASPGSGEDDAMKAIALFEQSLALAPDDEQCRRWAAQHRSLAADRRAALERLLADVLKRRFGTLDAPSAARLAQATTGEIQAMLVRAESAATLADVLGT